jgi:DNA-binding NtrC family response regulator
MYNILIIDDTESIRDSLSLFFTDEGFHVASAPDGETGLDMLKREKFDIYLVDLVMPGMGGLEVLKEAVAGNISVPCIVMTGHATVQTAVDAMKLGAFDYVTKPFMYEELLINIRRALDISKLQRENEMLKKQLKREYDLHGLIGTSPQIQKLHKYIEKIADTESTVLIYGESGTGKEIVAKTIHFNSSRSSKPFIPLNCAAIPKDLLESELFGHEKGSFTGAHTTRVGRFELADGGTLLLDEIGELHPNLQAKILRVLQEKEFERVGGTKTIKSDVRILAATNKDLLKATKEGTFREDLYYRLNVIPLHIPPLRERKEDIAVLLEHFMSDVCRRKKKKPLTVCPSVMEHFMNYSWPGNVRELENLIERLVILDDDGLVSRDDLPERFFEAAPTGESRDAESLPGPRPGVILPPDGLEINAYIDSIERDLILQALERAGGVKKNAAALLGLNRTTLLDKLKKKGIHADPAATEDQKEKAVSR